MIGKDAEFDDPDRSPEGVAGNGDSLELSIMAAICWGREDIGAGLFKTHEEVGRLLELWADEWVSK